MKIILTATSDSLDCLLDERFGRAAYFLLYDVEQKTAEFFSNEQSNAAQGAGIQAAQNIVELGVECLITGTCGPKALRVLNSAGIEVYNIHAMPIGECIDLFVEGNLPKLENKSLEGIGVWNAK